MQIASANERALILGIFAVVSAVLGWYLRTPHFLIIRNTDPLPALWFGFVLCIGIVLWASHSLFDLFTVLLASFIAWVAAVETTIYIIRNIVDPITSRPSNFLVGMCGMIGGFVGSAIIVFAISAILRGFRTGNGWAKTIFVGTVAGSWLELIVPPSQNGLPIHIGSELPLFLVWQTSVAASIAFNLKTQASR
jgi:hypothetical protein